jgi:hypothetical protein
MQRLLFPALLGVAIVMALPTAAFSAEDELSGFTLRQLDAAITKSGLATQKIYSIQTFDSEERRGANVAILSGSHSDWHVTILHRVEGGLEVEWRSGKLPDDMEVSSSSNLEIEYMDDGEQIVKFSGCAAHDFGGLDGIFGVLLYSPHSRQVFFAHYRYDEGKQLGSFGSLYFSNNASAPGNEKYKTALQKAMSQTLGK